MLVVHDLPKVYARSANMLHLFIFLGTLSDPGSRIDCDFVNPSSSPSWPFPSSDRETNESTHLKSNTTKPWINKNELPVSTFHLHKVDISGIIVPAFPVTRTKLPGMKGSSGYKARGKSLREIRRIDWRRLRIHMQTLHHHRRSVMDSLVGLARYCMCMSRRCWSK
jgi:hypothetical protein